MKRILLIALLLSSVMLSHAQLEKPKEEKKWFEKMKLGGYSQLRYNRLLETNPDLRSENNDRSWGRNNSFYFRRIRLVYSGQISERLYGYIQIEASANVKTTSENWMYLQIRDAYFDYGLDQKNEFRLRFGQSKVPFGFDNLQSSAVRLCFDRTDALNSG
ncbi:MAG: porin, partial [Bacteroidota bacterium]